MPGALDLAGGRLDLWSLAGRFCDTQNGRLAYVYNAFANLFGEVAIVNGTPAITLDAPTPATAGRSPTSSTCATTRCAPAGAHRLRAGQGRPVTLKVYDVAGRQVRTLLDGQLFKAGEHSVTWDGVDDAGRRCRAGVLRQVQRESGPEVNTKVTILK